MVNNYDNNLIKHSIKELELKQKKLEYSIKDYSSLKQEVKYLFKNKQYIEKVIKKVQSIVNKNDNTLKTSFNISNNKLLVLQQIITVALLGEPYHSLVNVMDKIGDYQDSIKNEAYLTVKQNSAGIKTQKELLILLKKDINKTDSYNQNIFDNIKNELNKLIVINYNDSKTNYKIEKKFETLVNLVSNGKIEGSILLAKSLDSKLLSSWIFLAEQRVKTLDALNVLIK